MSSRNQQRTVALTLLAVCVMILIVLTAVGWLHWTWGPMDGDPPTTRPAEGPA